MLSTRILIVANEGPDLRRAEERLSTEGYETYPAYNEASGLLLLGNLQPDIVVLDPLAGRGRPEDWKRALERYRVRRPLAVVLTTDDPAARRALTEAADLGVLPRSFDLEHLSSIVDEFDDDGEFLKAG